MNILTFDTSLDKTYITLTSSNKVLNSIVVENHNEKYHSAFLIPTIVKVLKENKFTMSNIDAIGTNIGPGSFTGIRACVTVARVIAQQLNLPIVGVSSLELLSHISKENEKKLVMLDARKNQYYTAIYKNNQELSKPTLTNADDVFKMDLENMIIISDKSSHEILKTKNIKSIIYTEANENLGLFLSSIVERKLNSYNKDDYNWAKLKPLYLQSPAITIKKTTSIA